MSSLDDTRRGLFNGAEFMWSDVTFDASYEVVEPQAMNRRLSESEDVATSPPPTSPPSPPAYSFASSNNISDYIVNVSAGEGCPEGYIAPTIQWCEIYAGEQGLWFMVTAAPPIDVVPMCSRRSRLDMYGEYVEEFAGSYLKSEACPRYIGVRGCVCISVEYEYSPPPPLPPGIYNPPPPASSDCKGESCIFDLDVIPCEVDPIDSPSLYCQTLELQKRDCLRVSARAYHTIAPTWFLLAVKATCSRQERVNGSDVATPSECLDMHGSIMSNFVSVYDTVRGLVLSASSFYDSSKGFPNAPSTASQCDLLIPLAAGAHMTFDYDDLST
eukprot:3173328-Pleurochrysis_carterae.AAC.1